MTVTGDVLVQAAQRLHTYLLQNHWRDGALTGPDSGIRLNARFGRFLKSYLGFVPWKDAYVYLQAQGYWVLDNWLMNDLALGENPSGLALACSRRILAAQHPDGHWDYPNPEWRGRIATVEGDFAALGLLESYRRNGDESLLDGVKRWYRFLIYVVGFQSKDGTLAVNYFANVPSGMVPNNTTLTLLTCARLAEATGDDQYLDRCKDMVAFLENCQLKSGELPYSVGNGGTGERPHFLCYQYNAFEFIDLVHYYRITQDQAVWRIMERLAGYLATGITPSGAARYDCSRALPEVPYYSTALGAALSQATALGIGEFRASADSAYQRVLSLQRSDGGIEYFSRGNYGVLKDRRSYPRNLSMILYHLLMEGQLRASAAGMTDPTSLDVGGPRIAADL